MNCSNELSHSSNKRHKGHGEAQEVGLQDDVVSVGSLISDRMSLVSLDQMGELLKKHASQKLPDCEDVFPWLHGYSGENEAPHCLQWVAVIRSQPMSTGLIENSGLLRSSLDPQEFLMSLESHKHHLDAILQNITGVLNLKPIEATYLKSACKRYKVLPFLKSDAKAQSLFGAGASSRRVGRSSSHHHSSQTWKQPGLYRRFDLQVAKFIQMSENCVIYCLDDSEHWNSCPCQQLALLVHVARQNIDPQKKFFTRILESTNVDPSWWGTPPMTLDSLRKEGSSQLASDFDIASFDNWDRDLFYRERLEISKMSSASRVSEELEVWSGNSTDFEIYKLTKGTTTATPATDKLPLLPQTIVNLYGLSSESPEQTGVDTQLFNIPHPLKPWRLFVHCSENSQLPELSQITALIEGIQNTSVIPYTIVSFPNSGSIGLGNLNLESIKIILNTCFLIYSVGRHTNFGSLIYCSDGYTESSFLLVAFLIFAWDIPLAQVLLRLHTEAKRPYFLFPIDLQVLGHLQVLLREQSPRRKEITTSSLDVDPQLFSKMFFNKVEDDLSLLQLKGPLPSKILPYLYLGSLEHAQNPNLLRELGITNIVSVGETMPWLLTAISRKRSLTMNDIESGTSSTRPLLSGAASMADISSAPTPKKSKDDLECSLIEENGFRVLHITDLDDNGQDRLLSQLGRILEFINDCYNRQEKVLVHCMVGVSRSATVCIAECMRRLNCDVLRAYLYVRVRRLNIIIQPNLMFVYELCKWQESQGKPLEFDWHILCRAISELNSVYF